MNGETMARPPGRRRLAGMFAPCWYDDHLMRPQRNLRVIRSVNRGRSVEAHDQLGIGMNVFDEFLIQGDHGATPTPIMQYMSFHQILPFLSIFMS
jgi:hypothetical protein